MFILDGCSTYHSFHEGTRSPTELGPATLKDVSPALLTPAAQCLAPEPYSIPPSLSSRRAQKFSLIYGTRTQLGNELASLGEGRGEEYEKEEWTVSKMTQYHCEWFIVVPDLQGIAQLVFLLHGGRFGPIVRIFSNQDVLERRRSLDGSSLSAGFWHICSMVLFSFSLVSPPLVLERDSY